MTLFPDQQSGLPGFEHRDGTWRSLDYMMQLFGVSDRALQIWAKEGIIPPSEQGMYNLEGSVKGVYLHQRNLIAGAGSSQLTDIRVQREKIRKESEAMDLDLKKGSLVEVDDVIADITTLLMNIRSKLLYLPRKIAQAIPNESSLPAREAAGKMAVNEIMMEMEAYDPAKFRGMAPEAAAGGDNLPVPACGADSQPVG